MQEPRRKTMTTMTVVVNVLYGFEVKRKAAGWEFEVMLSIMFKVRSLGLGAWSRFVTRGFIWDY